MKDLVLALDFGGTKLAAAVIDLGTEKIIGPVIQQPTPVTEGAGGTLQAMIHCGEQALAVLGQPQLVKAVGISFGGPVSQDRKSVLLSNHVANWNGARLVDEISRAFKLPAFMDNDGNAIGLVTSGTFSPTLKVGIALALIEPRYVEGDLLTIDVRGRQSSVTVTALPLVPSHVR